MIKKEKLINTIAQINLNQNDTNTEIKNDTNHEVNESKQINYTEKKNRFNTAGKYSIITTLFVLGLIFVSIVKNETRDLEKNINGLRVENNQIKYDLEQAILDFEVITSPENLSILAKEYLNDEFRTYKKSQIVSLNHNSKSENVFKKKTKNTKKETKNLIFKEVQKRKNEIKKLQTLASNPVEIPGEIKTRIVKSIEEKKLQIKNLYTSPKETMTKTKAQRWVILQVAKAFFGVPFVPGK